MAFCESCGRRIPDGQRLCEDCAAEGRRKQHWKEELSRAGEPEQATDTPCPEGQLPPELNGPSEDLPDPDSPGPQGPAAASKTPGKVAVAVMSGLLALFLIFFGVAVFFGGGSPSSGTPTNTLEIWQGAGEDPNAVADPGPDTLEMVAPDAQSILANTPPTHTYQIVVEDVSWQEAYDRALAAGGHLATITSQEEFDAICAQADQAAVATGVRYLWLGARQGAGGWTGTDCWITGEDWTFAPWYPGEPSGQDADGTPENVLCMWNVQQSGWTFNDQRQDLLSVLPEVSGKVGYVIEFEG